MIKTVLTVNIIIDFKDFISDNTISDNLLCDILPNEKAMKTLFH